MVKNISAPLARTARLLDLVPFLNTHQGISLKELARQFDVSTAQMSSDLTTLWMCGLPGYTPLELMDLDFESGYVTIHNAPTLAKPRSITFDEGVALILGLDLLSATLTDERNDLLGSIKDLKQKISSKLGVPVSLKAQPKTSPQISLVLNEALEKKLFLKIQYHSLYRDEVTNREIQPLEIVDLNENQYLRAFCFSAGGMRDFRIDRIIQSELKTERPITSEASTTSQRVDFTISLTKPSRDVVERFDISYSDLAKNHRLSSFSQQWIERSIMASGEGVELIEPLHVRAAIAAKAQLILDRYKGA
jgi:proteasome accessory factor C